MLREGVAHRTQITRDEIGHAAKSISPLAPGRIKGVSTLSDLVGEHTDLTPKDIDRLHSLVADWAMLADLSFADLLLCVRIHDGDEFMVVAQVRPATGPTVYADDMVTTVLKRWTLSTAVREERIVREGDPEWERG